MKYEDYLRLLILIHQDLLFAQIPYFGSRDIKNPKDFWGIQKLLVFDEANANLVCSRHQEF